MVYFFTFVHTNYGIAETRYNSRSKLKTTIMKTLEIRIPELGNSVGTLSYVAGKLEHINNTIKATATNANEPALSYEHWSDKDKEGKAKRYILCFISNSQEFGYLNMNKCYCVNPIHDDYGQIGLFSVLTDKANEKVMEYLDALTEKFYSEYHKN